MSIVQTRIDSRLVHGQVLEAWVPALSIRRIVVADARTAGDLLARAAMEMAIPPEVELVVGAPEAIDWRSISEQAGNTLVVVPSVDAARDLLRFLDMPKAGILLNVGVVQAGEGRRQVLPGIHLSRGELDELEEMAGQGVRVEARGLPTHRPLDLAQLVQRFEDTQG